jgi:hypothetical protein
LEACGRRLWKDARRILRQWSGISNLTSRRWPPFSLKWRLVLTAARSVLFFLQWRWRNRGVNTRTLPHWSSSTSLTWSSPLFSIAKSSQKMVPVPRSYQTLLEKMEKRVEYIRTMKVFKVASSESRSAILSSEDNLVTSHWPIIARIIETTPEADGIVRVVSVKTKDGTYKWPVTKGAFLLPHVRSNCNSNICYLHYCKIRHGNINIAWASPNFWRSFHPCAHSIPIYSIYGWRPSLKIRDYFRPFGKGCRISTVLYIHIILFCFKTVLSCISMYSLGK